MNDEIDKSALWKWDGDAMTPYPAYVERLREQLTPGEVYRLAPRQDPSPKSRGHLFVLLRKAWETLPEKLHSTYPTAVHLRKKAMINKGWAEQQEIVFDSPKDAMIAAAFVRRIDTYSVALCSGRAVTVWTAKSIAPMEKDEFQACKNSIFDFVSQLLGADITEME